ncbi:MAG: hypothetical protein ACTTIC_01455 [Helicobacteraceae bacterium]
MKYVYALAAFALFAFLLGEYLFSANDAAQREILQKQAALQGAYELRAKWQSASKAGLNAFLAAETFRDNDVKISSAKNIFKASAKNLDENELNSLSKELFSKNYRVRAFAIQKSDKQKADFSLEVEF